MIEDEVREGKEERGGNRENKQYISLPKENAQTKTSIHDNVNPSNRQVGKVNKTLAIHLDIILRTIIPCRHPGSSRSCPHPFLNSVFQMVTLVCKAFLDSLDQAVIPHPCGGLVDPHGPRNGCVVDLCIQ